MRRCSLTSIQGRSRLYKFARGFATQETLEEDGLADSIALAFDISRSRSAASEQAAPHNPDCLRTSSGTEVPIPRKAATAGGGCISGTNYVAWPVPTAPRPAHLASASGARNGLAAHQPLGVISGLPC